MGHPTPSARFPDADTGFTHVGVPTPVTTRWKRKAYDYNGSTQYTKANSFQPIVNGSTVFSVGVWADIKSLASQQTFLSQGESPQLAFKMQILADNRLRAVVYANTQTAVRFEMTSTDTDWEDSGERFYSFKVNGNTGALYVDGLPISQTTQVFNAGNVGTQSGTHAFGIAVTDSQVAPSDFTKGIVHTPVFWTADDLSDAQILHYYGQDISEIPTDSEESIRRQFFSRGRRTAIVASLLGIVNFFGERIDDATLVDLGDRTITEPIHDYGAR